MIPRREKQFVVAGIFLLLAGAYLIFRTHEGPRETVIAGAAVRILQPTSSPEMGAAVVFHGLSANRILMEAPGRWLAAQGFRVYLVDAPGHGNTPGPFSHAETLDSSVRVLSELQRAGQIDPQTTILVGHSMGGEMAIRLADHFPCLATIAISPAPMVLPRRMPSNLLVISAQFDFSPMKAIAETLLQSTGGVRASPEDFQQRRAANRIVIPWSSHTSLLLDRGASKAMAGWARMAVGLAGPANEPSGSPMIGELLGIVGLVLAFPLAATFVVSLSRPEPPLVQDQEQAPARILLSRWIVAAMLALGVVSLWYPHRIFPFYTGGYLAFFLFFVGIALVLLFKQHPWGLSRGGYRPAIAALVMAMFVILALGTWLNWHLTDVWMNGIRWFYFVPLVFANLPYTMAEELALGSPAVEGPPVAAGPPAAAAGGALGARRAWRIGMFLLLRFILWIVLLAGLFALLSGQVLLALLAPYLVIVSLGQRLGADALRRRTGSPAAASIFSAILAAWFIAAVFPLS